MRRVKTVAGSALRLAVFLAIQLAPQIYSEAKPLNKRQSASQETTQLAAGEYSASISGLKLWYKVAGIGPVCIVPTPGWGPSADLYFRTLKPLEESFTLVYLETRGTGRSEKPPKSTDYTYEQFAADLEGLRQHLKLDRIWVLGHSQAGVHAMQYALRYPRGCRGLILLDTPAAFDKEHKEDVRNRIMERQKEPWFTKGSKVFASNSQPDSDEAMAAQMLDILPFYFYDLANIERHKESFAATRFSSAAFKGQTDSRQTEMNLIPRLSEIKIPALIIVGSNDFICSPREAERIHLGITGSKLIVIDKAGHFPWLEQPDEFFTRVKRGLAALWVSL